MNQSELIGAFSHEIRNPLTLINSSLQLLEVDCPEVLNSSLWSQIRQDMLDVLRLLNDMSSLNKSSHITQTTVSVSDFLSGIESSVRPLMEEKGILFTVSPEAPLRNICLWADSLKLKEAVTNLLLNAIDAVSALTCQGQVFLFAEQTEQSCISIHVRDNGPGIPAEYMDTLFEPFVTHKPHGTGLGLGIVQNIVKQHNGSITVNTCTDLPNTYTDFCLRLPMA